MSGDRVLLKILINEDLSPWVAERLRVDQLIMEALESDAAAGRDMVNRVLRVSANGAAELFPLPEQ